MHTSRFQLGLIATLAMGLGFSLSSSEAIGYPAGAVVSTGSNPVVSVGGAVDRGSSATVMSADTGQDIVITDMAIDHVMNDLTCLTSVGLDFTLASSGDVVAKRVVSSNWWANSYSGGGHQFDVHMNSGIRVPAGDALLLSTTRHHTDSCGPSDNPLVYTVSGYYAQP